MKIKICSVLFGILALPLVIQATTGCSFQAVAQSPEPVDPNAYVCACSCGPGLRHRELRVAAGVDDAEQRLDTSILLDSPDLDFENGRFVGLRFPGLLIPKDAHISSANLQFTAAPGNTIGSVTMQIAAEKVGNAPAFTTIPNSIGALPLTTNTVQWPITAPWTAGTAGPDQFTPNFNVVLQEIVDQPSWVQGNALAVIIRGTAGTAIRKGFTVEGNPGAAALLVVDYTEPNPTVVGPQNLSVCLPSDLGAAATNDQLAADCQNRVQKTLSGLAAACSYPSDCHCGMQATDATFRDSFRWAASCDKTCVEDKVDVAHDCANFDPAHGLTTATNADGDKPVCAAFSPLAAEVFGQRTTCAVEGTAHVEVGDESKNPHAQGTVQFVGSPCVGGGCAVNMQYKLDIDPVTFGNFFHSETFHDLGGIGETSAAATLSAAGDGSFARDAAGVAAQGRRGSELRGLATTNDDPVDVNVGFGSNAPTCRINGTLIGGVDPELKRCENAGPTANKICSNDSDCEDDPDCSDEVCNCLSVSTEDLSLALDVDGDILNQPPKADAGSDQTVECATAAVTNVSLDGSKSSDLDSNLALFTWLRGTRGGPVVGFDQISNVEQSRGTQSYVLRVIDALGQTDEDTMQVNVVDTTPPVVRCDVATPGLNQSNHDLVNVGLTGSAVDRCEGELPVQVSVFGNEDDEENASGNTCPDAKDIALDTLRLRAERKGSGQGRVYLIVTEATDSAGNRGSDCCTVNVPLDSSSRAIITANALATAARDYCTSHDGTPPPGFFTIGDGPIIGSKQ